MGARAIPTCISELIGSLEASDAQHQQQYPWAERFVMGMPLPSWQRPLVWTSEQQIRFITSIWEGVDIGSYLVNDIVEFDAPDRYRKFSDIVLDGQQRLHAIQCYLQDLIAVPDALGQPRLWSELGRIERRRFGQFQFARATVCSWDESFLRKVYDLRAFGGTPHAPDQRASIDR